MAKEEIFFGINIDTGQTIKTFGELKDRTKKLKKELDGLDVGSKRFNELQREITANQSTIRRFNRSLRDTRSLATRVGQGMTNAFKSAGAAIAGAFAVREAFQFGKKVADVTAQFEKLQAVLENTLGSKGQAKKAFQDIEQFASETNFSVLELSDAFVKLANQGFVPTIDEMGNLADVANSTGKSFDQLAEAIIDAQVGEFERLKEFGIRAKKEGDQVKFTFKGVETQVNNTEGEIRKYILALGDLNGVSGATDKISKTLGGAISNLGDAFDSFLASLGQADGLLGSVIRGIVDLSSGFLKLITPSKKASDAIINQKVELGLLTAAIVDTNTSEKDRLKAINELNDAYPGFLDNLDAEKVSNGEILSRLKEVNKALENKLLLQLKDEQLQEARQESLDNLRDREEEEQSLREQLIAAKGVEFLANKDLVQAAKELEKEYVRLNKASGSSIRNGVGYGEELVRLRSGIKNVTSAQDDFNESLENINDLSSKRKDIVSALFGGEDLNTEAIITDGGTKDGETYGIAIANSAKKRLDGIFTKKMELEGVEEEIDAPELHGLEQIKIMEEAEQEAHENQIRRAKEKIDLNNNKLQAMSNLFQGTISLLSKDEEARKKNAKLIKALALADIAVNTQRALSNIWVTSSSPLDVGNLLTGGLKGKAFQVIQTAALLASAAASAAAVSSQKFAKGGILQGASHAQGGIKTPYGELEGGEAVINKKSTKKFGGILSAINEAGGGKKFAEGGVLGVPSTTPTGDPTQAQLLGALDSINFEPTVSVVEINKAQTRVSSIESNSTL